jgi:CBS domain-containing membrane protein
MTNASPPRRPLQEILWASAGAFLGIYAVAISGKVFAHLEGLDPVVLLGSFGAAAVLIYGYPYAEFSQPRNVVLGQVLSALVGVTVTKVMPAGEQIPIAGATAVALSILLMHLTRTMHPPGGSTALLAVLGNDRLREMGYQFVLYPVLLGACVLVAVALLVHNLPLSQEKRYPTYWW